MIYWITGSIGTSMRYYYETMNDPWRPSHDRWPVIEAPTGIAVFPNEVILQPRRWAERYYNLKRWTKMSRGGHFAPMEQPEEMVAELRAFFRPLRT
jgi:pimeloyl-ACP methyl ester carboxylesterase